MIKKTDYTIKASANGKTVELWSVKRPPFEPKGSVLEMRNELREHLGRMHSDGASILRATYVSLETDLCDIENVLIYNVGSYYFRNIDTHRIILERKVEQSPLLADAPADIKHYCRYEIIAARDFSETTSDGNAIVSWKNMILPKDLPEKLAPYWLAMKKADVTIKGSVNSGSPSYGIRLRLQVSHGTTMHITQRMKPLLDGIISAFHVHDGTDLSEVAGRIADQVGITPDVVGNLLMEERLNVLGFKRVVVKRASGVQWSPDDHLVLYIDMEVGHIVGNGAWTMEGAIFGMSP